MKDNAGCETDRQKSTDSERWSFFNRPESPKQQRARTRVFERDARLTDGRWMWYKMRDFGHWKVFDFIFVRKLTGTKKTETGLDKREMKIERKRQTGRPTNKIREWYRSGKENDRCTGIMSDEWMEGEQAKGWVSAVGWKTALVAWESKCLFMDLFIQESKQRERLKMMRENWITVIS